MSGIAKIYTDVVHQNLNPLYANWEPGRPVELGDLGLLRDHTFVYLGNIRDHGIKISERADPASDQKFFASEGAAEVQFHAKGSVPLNGIVTAKAALEVNFSGKEAVFFNAAGCNYTMIADKVRLGREVMDRYKAKQWQREWAVVTDLVKAGNTTLAVSGGNAASIVFEATGDVERINLADASAGLTIRTAKNIGYQVVAENGLIPLFGLCKIQGLFLWWDPNFKPLSRALADTRLVDALEVSPHVKTEESDDALFFGQLK